MAEVKTINNTNPDTNKNILTEVIINQNDTIPTNLAEDGWILKTIKVRD